MSGMEHPFPVAADSSRELREVFADPQRWLATPSAEARARVLDLARWLSGGAGAALVTAGGCWGDEGLGEGAPLDLEAPRARGAGGWYVPLRVPLLPGGLGSLRTFATLVLGAGDEGDHLERLARHATSVLLDEALRRVSEADALTGLPGRLVFERALPSASARLAAGEPVSLVFLAADGLRDLQLVRGRGSGDELLRTLGVLLQGAVGRRGLAARYGDQRLAVLAPGMPLAEARAWVEGLNRSVSQLIGFGEPAPTISVGIAAAPEHADTIDLLVLRADQALARARDEGRGRVVTWAPSLLQQRREDVLAGLLTGHQARDHLHARSLLETVEAVSRLAPLDECRLAVVDRCVAVAEAERGLLLRRGDDGSWCVQLGRLAGGLALAEQAPPFAASLAEEAYQRGHAVSRLSEAGVMSPSAEVLGLSAVLVAPLVGDDVPAGAVYVDSRSRREAFDTATVAFFDALVGQLGLALRNATLYQRLLDRAGKLRSQAAGREAELVRMRARWEALSRHVPSPIEGLVGSSPPMQEVFRLLKSVEGTAVPVVVEGESGTGKELVARSIHASSGRSGPLITVNCAAIPPGLFESELFGHVDGAFTGACGDRAGLLESAHDGTLFMDEVGELPLAAQAKLLRALQEGEVRRLGDSTSRAIDVRIVAATNRDLQAMVREGTFREDLYYRLAVFCLKLPPLRSRTEDIPAISAHLLQELNERTDKTAHLTPAALRALVRHPWPGNVRQLRNVIERAAVLAGGAPIGPEHVELPHVQAGSDTLDSDRLLQLPLKDAKATFTLLYAQEMLRRADGSMSEAARLAGVTRQTIYRIVND
jgi:diguanylate cyclase (GGDEF)-like protein